jgi:hypothetical protein
MAKLNREFKITDNIVATITDNASNFSAAFRVFGEGNAAEAARKEPDPAEVDVGRRRRQVDEDEVIPVEDEQIFVMIEEALADTSGTAATQQGEADEIAESADLSTFSGVDYDDEDSFG